MYPIADFKDFLRKSKEVFEESFFKKTTPGAVTLDNFEKLRTIGTGAFGRVMVAKEKNSGDFYAMKIMKKQTILKQKQTDHVLNEKRVLQALKFPFTVNLEYFFQDSTYIYFILPFISGGEMFSVLRKEGKFPEDRSRFYGAQVLLALEYLHYLDIMYRDLKPENILLDKTGYLKITDFGFAKIVKGRTYTMCGTPEYIAPEVLMNKGYGKSADWWSFGVLLFEMTAGYPPFYANEPMQIYEKIISCKFKFASSFSKDLKDLLTEILVIDLSKRLGNLKKGVEDLKCHKWFSKVQWLAVLNMRVEPPFIPKWKSQGDASNFDHYKEERFILASVDRFAKEFADF